MAEKSFTLLELHLDGPLQFGPRQLGSSTADSETPENEATDTQESGGIGRIVFGLVLLITVVAIAKKLRGGDDDGGVEATEPDIVVS